MNTPERPRRPDPAETAGDPAATASRPPAETRPPKPYRRPRLVSYGRLTDVTQFGGSQVVDSGAGLGQQI
ncbi:MAG TPA: hypothetical protein VM599_00235 [Thermoanaerobaculia bacterium]|nr:hypothetical protein [Thermoanaerobaculia bacterium]